MLKKSIIAFLVCFIVFSSSSVNARICFAPSEQCDDSIATKSDCSGDYRYTEPKGEGWNCDQCGGKWKCTQKACVAPYKINANCSTDEIRICEGKSGDKDCCVCANQNSRCVDEGYSYVKTDTNERCSNPCPYDDKYYEICYCNEKYKFNNDANTCYKYSVCELGDLAGTKKYQRTMDLLLCDEYNNGDYAKTGDDILNDTNYTCSQVCEEICNATKYYQCAPKADEQENIDCDEAVKNQVITYEFSMVRDADQKRKMIVKSENCDAAPHTVGVGMYYTNFYDNSYAHAYGWKCDKEIPLDADEALGIYDDVLIYIDFSGLLEPTGPNHNDLQNLNMLYEPNWQGHVLRFVESNDTSGGWGRYYEGHSGYASYSEPTEFLDAQKSRYKIDLPSKGCSPQVRLIFHSNDFPTGGYCVEQDGYYASEEACMKPHTQKDILPYVTSGLSGDNVSGYHVDYPNEGGIGCRCSGAGTGSGTPAGLGHGGLYGPRPTGETSYFAFSDCCLDMLQFDESKFKWLGHDSNGIKAQQVFLAAKRELLDKVFGGDVYNTNHTDSDLKYSCEYQEKSGCYIKKVEIPNSCFDYKDAHFESSCSKENNKTTCKFRVSNSYDNYNGYYFPLFMYHLNIKVKNAQTGEIEQNILTTGMADNWKKATYDGEVVSCELERDDTPSVVGDSQNSHILWQSEGPDCALDKILGDSCSLE